MEYPLTDHKKHGNQCNQRGKSSVTGHQAVCQNSDQSFSGGIDDTASNNTGSIAAKSHAHGQCLFTAGICFLKTVIQIKCNTWKIAKVFQQGKEREKIAIGGSITETTQARTR